MQRETRVAPSTGTRGGEWGAINFLYRNAGKMTIDRGKTREFKDKAREASCPPSGIKRMVEFEGSNKILRCANYVCSENRGIVRVKCITQEIQCSQPGLEPRPLNPSRTL